MQSLMLVALAITPPTVGFWITLISLQDLVSQADRIFIGTVESTSPEEKVLGDGSKLSVTKTVFRISHGLKGVVPMRLTVYQYRPFAFPLAKGQEVLWFLPAESAHGLARPHPCGAMTITYDQKSSIKRKMVISNLGNVGLWPSKQPIWTKNFKRANLLEQLKLETPKRAENLMKLADAPFLPQGLPLELMIAAIKTYVSSDQQKKE